MLALTLAFMLSPASVAAVRHQSLLIPYPILMQVIPATAASSGGGGGGGGTVDQGTGGASAWLVTVSNTMTKADDSAFTVGTDLVAPVAGIYRSTRDAVDDGDTGAFAMTPKRALYATLETPNADSAMDETNDAVRANIVASIALPAGSATIGSLASILTNVVPGTGAADLGKAEDAGHTTGDVGVFILGVRNDANSTLCAGANDYCPVNVGGSGQVGTKIEKSEDVAAASGDIGVPTWSVREDAPTTTAANGDYIARKANLYGHQYAMSMCEDPALVQSVVISTASSGNVELVALTSTQIVYVCGFSLVATGAVAVQFIYGTGSACATGETDLTGAMPFAANGGMAIKGYQFKTAASNALCIELSAAVQVDGVVQYLKFVP